MGTGRKSGGSQRTGRRDPRTDPQDLELEMVCFSPACFDPFYKTNFTEICLEILDIKYQVLRGKFKIAT